MVNAQLVASGAIGYLGVANGVGNNVEEASSKAYELARKIVVPNLRYRNDIGGRVIAKGMTGLRNLGYID